MLRAISLRVIYESGMQVAGRGFSKVSLQNMQLQVSL